MATAIPSHRLRDRGAFLRQFRPDPKLGANRSTSMTLLVLSFLAVFAPMFAALLWVMQQDIRDRKRAGEIVPRGLQAPASSVRSLVADQGDERRSATR